MKNIPATDRAPDGNSHLLDWRKCFLMMRYRRHEKFRQTVALIKAELAKYHINLVIAEMEDKKALVWPNVTEHMNECAYGIALFDEYQPYTKKEGQPNPNICVELGYMLCQEKKCLLLVDTRTSKRLPDKLFSDLGGFIMYGFNSNRLADELPKQISRWYTHQIRVAQILESFAALFPGSKISKRLQNKPDEKRHLATYVIRKLKEARGAHMPLLMDSGSTTAAVAEALLMDRWEAKPVPPMEIHTNNLLISTLLGCQSGQGKHECFVVPGKTEDEFAGLFGSTPVEDIRKTGVKTAVLSCTGFDPKRGLLADSSENREFKLAAIRQCERVYLLVTDDKVAAAKYTSRLVFKNASEWMEVCKSGKIRIAISQGLPETLMRQFPDAVAEYVRSV